MVVLVCAYVPIEQLFEHMNDPRSPDSLDTAILTLILDRHPGPVHHDDLARAFRGSDWPSSVLELSADGLILHEGRLHLATRAAVRAWELLG